MNAEKNANRAAAAELAFHSFRGHDVDDGQDTRASARSRRNARRASWVKRKSARAGRRARRAEVQAAVAA